MKCWQTVGSGDEQLRPAAHTPAMAASDIDHAVALDYAVFDCSAISLGGDVLSFIFKAMIGRNIADRGECQMGDEGHADPVMRAAPCLIDRSNGCPKAISVCR